MTSRDYIYNRARKDLKEGAFPLLKESQVVIDVHDLTLEEKRQILYNHLKLGRQPIEFLSEVKPLLESVAAHDRFIPETARRLSDPLFTRELRVNRHHLLEFIDKREQFLQEVLQGVDQHSKAALALIYMRNGTLESPITLQESELEALQRLGSDLGSCVTALEALNGSLVQLTDAAGDFVWQFKHPTIGDAYAALLVQSTELLGIFVQGSTTEKLISQVTCGDVGIERAVIIPRSLFPVVLNRLSEFEATTRFKTAWMANWSARRSMQYFLAFRCSPEFLSLYLRENPEILDKVATPGIMLSSASEVDLAIRLHEFGLLPEETRKAFIERVSTYALDGQDMYVFEDSPLRSIFTDEEFQNLLDRARSNLVCVNR